MNILDQYESAQRDIHKGNFSDADNTLEWMFHNIHLDDPQQNNVRRSFIISAWVQLAYQYPPTMQKVLTLKNKALDEFRVTNNIEFLKDYFCIARNLDGGQEALDVFRDYYQSDFDTAKKIWGMVFQLLVKHCEWEILAGVMDKEDIEQQYALTFHVFNRKVNIEQTKEQAEMYERSQRERLSVALNELFKIVETKRDADLLDCLTKLAERDLSKLGLSDLRSDLTS